MLDASAVAEYLADGPHARAVGNRITAGQELWAPHLIDAEVGNVLRRGVALGAISPEGGRAALRDLSELPLNRARHLMLLDRAWELRDNVTFYDALYIALAEELGMRLITLDARLARAPGVRAAVDVIG